MLIKRHVLNKIVAGDINLAFRWWKRPTVKTGGHLRTAVGELAIIDVSEVLIDDLTDDDAIRAGYSSVEDLRTDLTPRPDRMLYRIALEFSGEDKRHALREDSTLSADQCSSLLSDLERIDKRMGKSGLALRTLALIDRFPERRAQELADELGLEKPPFKTYVRKLKERGLTESLSVGYRLSPRGLRLLKHARDTNEV